jgi:hypothetical protein
MRAACSLCCASSWRSPSPGPSQSSSRGVRPSSCSHRSFPTCHHGGRSWPVWSTGLAFRRVDQVSRIEVGICLRNSLSAKRSMLQWMVSLLASLRTWSCSSDKLLKESKFYKYLPTVLASLPPISQVAFLTGLESTIGIFMESSYRLVKNPLLASSNITGPLTQSAEKKRSCFHLLLGLSAAPTAMVCRNGPTH